jgi:hypothetical protein
VADSQGRFPEDRPLLVVEKAGIRDLTSQLIPPVKALGGMRKIFLTPLARYWPKPCCSDVNHHINITASSHLPALGTNISHLRDYVRDTLFTKRLSNFRVLCPNRMVGVGPHLSDEAAKDIGRM